MILSIAEGISLFENFECLMQLTVAKSQESRVENLSESIQVTLVHLSRVLEDFWE